MSRTLGNPTAAGTGAPEFLVTAGLLDAISPSGDRGGMVLGCSANDEPLSVSVLRAPRTGGTATPPRTARYVRTPELGVPTATTSPARTAIGLSIVEAAELVRGLAGPHRLPTALKRVDALARGR